MDNDLAIQQLQALLTVPGALKIITSEQAGNDLPLTDPRAFVCHDVTHFEGPDDKGRVKAHTAEGDWCLGYPADLLPRLQEAGRAGV